MFHPFSPMMVKLERIFSGVFLCLLVCVFMLGGVFMGGMAYLMDLTSGQGVPTLLPLWLGLQALIWVLSGPLLRWLIDALPLVSLEQWVDLAGAWGQVLIRGQVFFIPVLAALLLYWESWSLIIPVSWMVGNFVFWVSVVFRHRL